MLKRILLVTAALALALPLAASDLPLLGIAHVAFKSSDLDASRDFYQGVLGYEEAFSLADEGAVYFKVNDDQFVKLVKVPAPAPDDRLVEIALQTDDLASLRSALEERGLEPSSVRERADGTRAVTLQDPDGHQIAFVEYVEGSKQAQARGKLLGERRISDHLWHTGVSVADEAKAREFYEEKLGFKEIWRGGPEGQPTAWINVRMPGERGDYLEYMLHDEPPTRERLGSMHHIALQVDDIRESHRQAIAQGLPDEPRHEPRIGRIRRWLANMFDPDGTRSELMEPRTVSDSDGR